MTDEHVTSLFAEGTAPEHDDAFAGRVDARIGKARLGMRRLALAVRLAVIVTLVAIVFVTVRALGPLLGQLAETSPKFMGVPVPLVLGALAAGLVVRTWLFVRLRLS
jgi:hypothetical protein